MKTISTAFLRIAALICILQYNFVAAAQTKVSVFSAKDDSPLPYATITNFSRHTLIFADEKGTAMLRAVTGDSLAVSYVGYETYLARFSNPADTLIKLQPQEIVLDEMIVTPCKKTRQFNYNNIPKTTATSTFGGVAWSKIAPTAKVALRLSSGKTNARLKEFSFWIKRVPGSPESSMHDPLILSFYSVSDSGNLPAQPISATSIIYTPTKEGKQTLHLDSLHLMIPDSGVYVCFQYIMTDNYGWSQHMISESGEAALPVQRYGGFIDGVIATGFELVFYDVYKDEWFFPAHRTEKDYQQPHGTIRCEAIFEYCEIDR